MSTLTVSAARQIPAKVFALAIFSSKNNHRWALDSVALLPDGRIAATDGYTMAVVGKPQPDVQLFDKARLVPSSVAKLLAKASGNVTVEPDGSLTAELADGARVTAKLIDGEFPPVDQIVKEHVSAYSLLIGPRILAQVGQLIDSLGCSAARFDFPVDPFSPLKIVGMSGSTGKPFVELRVMPMSRA